PMQNLAHSASFDSDDNDEPSKPGIKHLGRTHGGLSDNARGSIATQHEYPRPEEPAFALEFERM
ncbi:hypothetical protein, partial [Mesorhizobium retamae]